VAKHAEKQQLEREQRAMSKLQLLVPQLGTAVLNLALQECNWNEEHAVVMLRRFQAAKAPELGPLLKERQRQLTKQAAPSASDSDSGSSGSSDGGDRRRRSSKSKSKKRSRDKHSKKSKKDKHGKKAKKDKDKHRGPSKQQDAYGKYGIIRETDMHSKRSEFILWAVECKGVDIEVLPKPEEKELFK
jgi:hypothetical protein